VQRPEWWPDGVAIQATIEPRITARAAYVVRLAGGGSWADVEVRAGDGKVSGYLESSVAPKDPRRNPLRPEERNPAPHDGEPRWSLDGKKIAFLSTRERPGFPLWWPQRPRGLFTVNADGTELQNVAPEAVSPPFWSPDGRYLAFAEKPAGPFGTIVQIFDTTTKTALSPPSPPGDESINVYARGWLAPHRLLLIWLHSGPGGSDLMEWNPEQPKQKPKLLVRDFNNPMGNESGAGGFALSRDEKTLYVPWYIPEQFSMGTSCSFALFTVPAANLSAQPIKLSDCLAAGQSVLPTPQGLFINGRKGAMILDTQTGKAQAWTPPPPLAALQYLDTFSDVQMSPDGQNLAFSWWITTEKFGKIRVLHTAHIDGSAVRALSPLQ